MVEEIKMTSSGKGGTDENPTTLDEILELIKPMGPWQILIMTMIAFVMFFQSMINLANVFNVYSPTHYCRIPELENANIGYDLVKNLSYPEREDKKGPDSCSRYKVDYTSSQITGDEDSMEAYIRDNADGTEKCDQGWHYEQDVMKRTIVTDFNLVCGEQVRIALTHSIYMAGFFVGSLIAGPLADYLGRKPTFIAFGILGTIFSIAMSFAKTYSTFLALRFFVAVGNVGGWLACFVLLQELMAARYRTWVGGLFWMPYALGYTCLSGFAYVTKDWMKLNLVISLPLVVYLSFIFVIPESFSWLLVNGKTEAAEKQARRFARFNGVKLSDNFSLLKAQEYIKEQDAKLKTSAVGYWSICFYPVYIVRTINIYFNWFVNSMVYYGLAFAVSSFSGDIFTNNALSGAVEIPGYLVCVPLLMWGRKKSLCLTLALAGVACFLMAIPYSEKLFPLKFFFFLVGRFAITASFAIVYVITSDLYPTVVRTTTQATSSMFARFGSMIAPFILAIPGSAKVGSSERKALDSIPPIVFGVFSILAAVLTLLLPETTGAYLPERIPDGLKYTSTFEKVVEKVCGHDCCCSPQAQFAPEGEIQFEIAH